jgi:hypothetical protein
MTETLDKDIADLVTVSMVGAKSGSSTQYGPAGTGNSSSRSKGFYPDKAG